MNGQTNISANSQRMQQTNELSYRLTKCLLFEKVKKSSPAPPVKNNVWLFSRHAQPVQNFWVLTKFLYSSLIRSKWCIRGSKNCQTAPQQLGPASLQSQHNNTMIHDMMFSEPPPAFPTISIYFWILTARPTQFVTKCLSSEHETAARTSPTDWWRQMILFCLTCAPIQDNLKTI